MSVNELENSSDFHDNNCMECTELDDMSMVQCDECDRWAHFRCVGVGPEIKDLDWSCRLCNAMISGLSLTDTEQVDASVGTEAEPPTKQVHASVGTEAEPPTKQVNASVGTEAEPPTKQIDASVGTEGEPAYFQSSVNINDNTVGSAVASDAQALIHPFEIRGNVTSSSVATEAQVYSSVGTDTRVVASFIASDAHAQALILPSIGKEIRTNVASSSIATEARALVHSSVGKDARTVNSFTASDAQSLNVNLNVGTRAQVARFENPRLQRVTMDNDLPVFHHELDDQNAFELYNTKLSKLGGQDMRETVREIGQALIADSVLMKYSYLGRRKKLRFKDFDNITKLVVASTIKSMNRRHFEVHGKAKVQSADEVAKVYAEVEKYFTAEYIKKQKNDS